MEEIVLPMTGADNMTYIIASICRKLSASLDVIRDDWAYPICTLLPNCELCPA